MIYPPENLSPAELTDFLRAHRHENVVIPESPRPAPYADTEISDSQLFTTYLD